MSLEPIARLALYVPKTPVRADFNEEVMQATICHADTCYVDSAADHTMVLNLIPRATAVLGSGSNHNNSGHTAQFLVDSLHGFFGQHQYF